jgi:hypothetical protein
VEAAHGLDDRLSGQVLEGDEGVDQAAIEEHPTPRRSALAIRQGHGDGPPSEGDGIDPRQRRAVARQFFSDDPAPRLLDNRVTAPTQLGQQGRLAAARAAGDDDEAVDGGTFLD